MENKKISRRKFIGSAAAAAAVMSIQNSSISRAADSSKSKFKLKYAPHFGMFRHHAGSDLIDQLKFMAEEGFTAMEDNNMMERPKDTQEKIAQTMSQLDPGGYQHTKGADRGHAHGLQYHRYKAQIQRALRGG